MIVDFALHGWTKDMNRRSPFMRPVSSRSAIIMTTLVP